EEQIALMRKLLRSFHGGCRHRLAERHGCGLDIATALAFRRATAVGLEFFAHPGQVVATSAVETQSIGGITVKLDDILGGYAGSLMQVVDVLRHQSRHLAGVIKPRERAVAAARPCG